MSGSFSCLKDCIFGFMNVKKVLYWASTIGLCGIMLYSAFMYFNNTEKVKVFFESFQYPTYIVIPLAIAKILGVIAILWNGIDWIKEWAYAGIFFDLVLATLAHNAADHSLGLSVIALGLLIVSYVLNEAVRANNLVDQ